MTWYRRLVRFLARKDLLESAIERQEAALCAYSAAVQLEMREKMAFARGELAGARRMADAVMDAIARRTGGADDFVQAGDVEAAKKGMIH